jgi:hypothetical protein
MQNNILTAKEWLEKEGKLDGVCKNSPNYKGLNYSASEAMELYASYKTKVLEDRILKFRKSFENTYEGILHDGIGGTLNTEVLEFIDKYFNIK